MFKKFQAAYQFGKTVAKQLKGNKSKVSPDITFIKPTFPKNKIQAAVRDVKKTARSARGQMKKQSQDFDAEINKVKSKLGQSMQKLKGEPVTKSGVSKGKDMKQDKARVKKMGGGMMGRRMGYSQGSNGKPISRSKNPGILAMSKTAKGRKVVKERFKFNPNRIVAKKGGKA